MGTPTSDELLEMISGIALNGKTLYIEQLCVTGLDLKLFEQRFAEMKHLLKYLEGFKPLKLVLTELTNTANDPTVDQLITVCGVKADEQCLWFSSPSYLYRPGSLFSLHPRNAPKVDVILLRSGGWIVLARFDDGTSDLKLCGSPAEVINAMSALAGDTFYYRSSGYRGLQYFPEGQTIGSSRMREAVPVALVLMIHLGTLLDRSIAIKEERLKKFLVLRLGFDEIEQRNGLSVAVV